jgi:hypothetical protein
VGAAVFYFKGIFIGIFFVPFANPISKNSKRFPAGRRYFLCREHMYGNEKGTIDL